MLINSVLSVKTRNIFVVIFVRIRRMHFDVALARWLHCNVGLCVMINTIFLYIFDFDIVNSCNIDHSLSFFHPSIVQRQRVIWLLFLTFICILSLCWVRSSVYMCSCIPMCIWTNIFLHNFNNLYSIWFDLIRSNLETQCVYIKKENLKRCHLMINISRYTK